ncbi:MAG: protein kinase, partial [Chloroflexia bacterium]|nr:protein kinase [Chloroflexia bacterium]
MEHSTISRRYRVDRRIGEGGMAEVFLGHDLLLNRAVAIKALRPQFAKDATFLLRFEREAIAVAGFIHPNIIDIYDVGEEQGTPYIVMEYVEGETLKEIIEHEAPFSPDDVAALLEQVGAALDYAHERGLVHRDIKPQNILVDPHGLAKVVDFGIAIGVTDSQLTEVGTGIGTVQYISPEQANGLMATPASDIYSLGVVAYEMLTGELPFDAASAVAIALSHVQDEPVKPSAINSTLQAPIDSIVLRALDKDPTRRFSTAGSFAHAISEWPGYQAISRNTPPASRRSSHVSAPRTPVKKVNKHSAARAPVDGVGCWTRLIGSIGLTVIVAAIFLAARYTSLLDDITASGDVAPPRTTTTQTTQAAAAGSPTFGVFVPFEPTTLQTQVEVPDLRGLSLDEATNLVNSRGLLLNQGQPVFSDSVPAGAVAVQAPPSGSRLEQGFVVSVSPSNGSANVDLASLGLVGMGVEEAVQRLTSRGLTVA